MKVWLCAVGRTGRLLGPAIADYETRAARYWKLEVAQVREERAARGLSAGEIRAREAERLLERAPPEAEVVALTRAGSPWSSEDLARYLEERALSAHPGPAFLIGGASGLADELLESAARRVSLSPLTLPHELARLVLTEQLYRAGTILRGEPYHKARERERR